MNIQESGEMYLETILVLSKEKANVRSVDVANHSGYSKPSVSRALGILKKGGLLEIDDNGYIRLSPSGEDLAQRVFERHNILTRALEAIGVRSEIAQEDACRMEHYISDETFDRIKEHLAKHC